MKTDYAEFIGKEIKYTAYSGEEYTGKIADCHYDIGITIVDANNKDRILTCLRNPTRIIQMAIAKGKSAEDINDETHKYYDVVFQGYVLMIADGHYNPQKTDSLMDGNGSKGFGSPTSDFCPFA